MTAVAWQVRSKSAACGCARGRHSRVALQEATMPSQTRAVRQGMAVALAELEELVAASECVGSSSRATISMCIHWPKTFCLC